YANRPSQVTAAGGFKDTNWHLLSRTFVATAPGSSDTAFYFGLPQSGAFTFQFAGASVQAVTSYKPATVSATPSKVLNFSGANGALPPTTDWSLRTGG